MLSASKNIMVASLILLINACGGESTSTEGFTNTEKSFVHNLFLSEYLWYDQVDKQIDYSNYSTPLSMVEGLRVTPPDKWSFTMTKESYDNYSQQKTQGFGFGYTSNYQIYIVVIGSPAYDKLQRGDIILEINGEPTTLALLNSASNNLNISSNFKIQRDSRVIELEITPKEYTRKVSLTKIISDHDKTIGYMRYDAFTSSSTAEIESAFTKLHNANIDDLVIDMRYNGGGSIYTAKILLDNITNAYPGQRQVYLDWNDNYKNNNYSYKFATESNGNNELDMQRVFFLTTKNSASASELVISALKPYLGENNIVTIGDYTHGKPVGMSGREYGENYYFLINFFVTNDDNQVISFDGIEPTCEAADDYTYEMHDTNESMLKTALYYMEYGQCPINQNKYTNQKTNIRARNEKIYLPMEFNNLIEITPSLSHD